MKNNILWSMNTWGGSCCQDCGITVPSPAVFEISVVYYKSKKMHGRSTYYLPNCRYMANCKGGNDWQGLELAGVGILKKDWKLLLFRDLDKKFVGKLLDEHRRSKEIC